MSLNYNDVIMGTIASQITSLTIVYSTVYSDADQRKHQSSASMAFVWGIHRGPVNSPHKWPVMGKMFPFYDVIMRTWIRLETHNRNPITSPLSYGVSVVRKLEKIDRVIMALHCIISYFLKTYIFYRNPILSFNYSKWWQINVNASFVF